MKKGTLIPLLLFTGNALFGQTTNNFSASGNATMGAFNYLKSGSSLYLQSTSTSSANWSRGILSQNIYWDNTGLQWQIPGPVSDFGMIRYEDRGTIGFFSNQSTGAAYTLNNTDLEAYRRMTIMFNGNVGIGVTTPGVKLEVKGSGRFTDAGAATTGVGLEMDYITSGDYGRVLSYDRTNSAYKPLRLNGSIILLNESSGGNVGIGTTTPAYRFHSVTTGNTAIAASLLYGDYYGTAIGTGNGSSSNYAFGVFGNMNSNGTAKTGGVQNLLFIRGDGNVAIGSNNPSYKLDVVGNGVFRTNVPGSDSYIYIDATSGFVTTGKNSTSTLQPLRFGVNNTEYMRISTTGNVGIGTTNPGTYALAVAGTVAAQAVKVTQSNWSDYVFDDGYKLASLSEVENYINQNKHLPDVPSAKEVTTNGIDLGDNQAVLLKKIEELTLYSIEQDKKLKEQGKNLQAQNAELDTLKKQLKEQSNLLQKLNEFIENLSQKN